MRSIYTICLAITLLAILSCKRDTASTADLQAEPSTTESSDTVQDNSNVTTSTPTPTGGHEYSFLTHELFHIGGAHVSGTKDVNANPYKAHWIDLEPNGTYKWGEHKTELYKGTWSYNHDSQILQLRPGSGKEKTSEWKVMHNDNMVVLLGTKTFGNNNTQIQLIRSTALPD